MTYASVCHSFFQISLLLVQYMTDKNRDLVQKYDIKNHDLVQNTCVYQLLRLGSERWNNIHAVLYGGIVVGRLVCPGRKICMVDDKKRDGSRCS